MSFLNPGMLFGLLSLVIPVVVLLLFRRKVVLQWAAYEWMAKARVETHKQSLRDDWLKLFAKLLLLLFLVLLVARPALRSMGGGTQLVVIDVSPSMGTVLDGEDRLERAKGLALDFLEGSGGRSAVYVFDGALRGVVKLGGAFAGAVERIERSSSSGSFEGLVSGLLALESFSEFDGVFFFSDVQGAHFDDAEGVKGVVERLGGTPLVLMPVDGRSGLENVGVVSFLPPAEGFFPGRANVLSVTVENFSGVVMRAVPVTLKVDGVAQDRGVVDLLPHSRAVVGLSLSMGVEEEARVTVEVPPDLFPLDDVLNVVVSPGRGLRVLAVVADRGDDPFEYDVFFESALRAFVPEGFVDYERVSPEQVFRVDLDNFDVVVTFGVSFAERSVLTDAVNGFLEGSGSLLAFSDLSVGGYWRELGVEDTGVRERVAVPDVDRLEGGYLDFMGEGGLDVGLISLFRYSGLVLGDEDGVGRLYVEGLDEPVVGLFRRGNSRLVLAGFMPYLGFSSVVYNPNFVQFALRMLSDSLSRPVFRSYLGEDVGALPLGKGLLDGRYTAETEDDVRLLEVVKGDGGGLFLSCEPYVESVFAEVKRDGEVLFGFGSGVSRVDSAIEVASPEALKALGCDGLRVEAVGDGDGDGGGRAERMGFMALLLLLALGFDHYAHFWRGVK